MDILAEAICFSDQNSLKLLMPFAKFSQKNLKKTLNKIISTQLSLHHAVRTLYFVYFSSFWSEFCRLCCIGSLAF